MEEMHPGLGIDQGVWRRMGLLVDVNEVHVDGYPGGKLVWEVVCPPDH